MNEMSAAEVKTVLVIDGTPETNRILMDQGYSIATEYKSAADLDIQTEQAVEFSAIVVDFHSESASNLVSQISELRQRLPFIPLLAVTESGDVETIVEALATGACDYLVRPLDANSLALRMETRMREFRMRTEADSFHIGDIFVQAGQRVISKDSERRVLSPTEMNMLRCLATARGTVVNRDVMKRRCWGQIEVSDNAVNRKLHEVRRALSSLSNDVSIKTIYGTGFQLEVRGV